MASLITILSKYKEIKSVFVFHQLIYKELHRSVSALATVQSLILHKYQNMLYPKHQNWVQSGIRVDFALVFLILFLISDLLLLIGIRVMSKG